MVHVRLATEDDAVGICQVYLTDVVEWYRTLPDGSRISARYEDLSAFERYLHGGPWMDPESCSVHIRSVVDSGQWPLVAIEGNEVVGELELIVGPDPRWKKTAHIDVLTVHREFRGRGVGRALVGDGRRRAEEASCDWITTNPEETAIEFYRKCGLETVLARQQDFSLPVTIKGPGRVAAPVPAPLASFAPLERLDHILGRFQTSYADWIKWAWPLPGLTGRIRREEGAIPPLNAYYRLRQDSRREKTAELQAWAPDSSNLPELLRSCVCRAEHLGFDGVETTIDAGDLPRVSSLGGTWGKETMILGRALKGRDGSGQCLNPT
jgi:ribosomal protein S18 acetylase RimI-like enzyme